jgi:hypothetical protein
LSISKDEETITAFAEVDFIYCLYLLFAKKEIDSLVAFSSDAMLLTTASQLPITLEFVYSAISASVYCVT